MDSTRISFSEYWRWKPGIPFLILATLKILRRRFPAKVALPVVVTVEVVDPQAQQPELLGALAEPIKACESAGRTLRLWYKMPTIGPIEGLAAALVSRDGYSVATALAAQADSAQREVKLVLVSRLRNGRFLTTGPGNSLLDPPPEVDALRIPGASYARLIEAHDRRVDSRRGDLAPCGDVRELLRNHEQRAIDANVARGVYVPASPQEVAMLEQSGARGGQQNRA